MRLLIKKLTFLSPVLLLAVCLSSGVVYASSSGYSATGVLGQSNFTDNGYGNTASQFYYPSSTVIDTVHHRLFVADDDNYRILVYQLDNNDQIVSQAASYALGAANPDSAGTDAVNQNSFSDGPYAMAYDPVNNRLFVEDYYRVLVFNLANGISNNMNASYVIGEPDFTSENDTASINTLEDAGYRGDGLAFDPTNDRLFVSDDTRIMVFDVSPATLQTNGNGENASYVIGQTNFTTTTSNEACTQNELNRGSFDEGPFSLAFDTTNQRLFVSDGYECERVLVFDVSPATLQTNGNGENASYVIGQTNFTNTSRATTQNGLYVPNGIGYDPTNNSLFVGDYYGNRIMVFDVSPATLQTNGNGENAYAVIGQPDFTTLNTGTSQTELAYNYYSNAGYAIDPTDNQLFLPDQGNNRVLTYNFISLTNSSNLANATAGSSYSQTLTTINSQGTVSFAVTGGSLPPGLSLNTTTGLISGTPTIAGTYTFEITAYDTIGTAGTFEDDPGYTITVKPKGATSSAISVPNTGFGSRTTNDPVAVIASYTALAMGLIAIRFGIRKGSK